MTVPPEVREQADARAAARVARDWPTADRLRAEIEAAGWKVIDTGTAYRLEPAHPADVELEGETRYGSSDAVPSRLDEAPTGLGTAIVVAREDPAGARRALEGLLRHAPPNVDAVLVIDGPGAELDALAASFADEARVEVLRTSAALGQGAALNIGLRRARGGNVVVLDASVEPVGDVVSPLTAALEDPAVAVAGPFGLASTDLRQFEETEAGSVAAIEGYLMAFRRSDAAGLRSDDRRGPLDEGFRFYRNLDVWWSLALRDTGPGSQPRTARVVEGLPIARHEHVAWTATPAAVRDRLSKRNFYRVLDRFRERPDLASG